MVSPVGDIKLPPKYYLMVNSCDSSGRVDRRKIPRLVLERDLVVAQDRLGSKVIPIRHHQPARQYANGPFKDAHVDVHLEEVYILAFEKGLCKSDQCWVVGAQKFFHGMELMADLWVCRAI